MIVNPPRGKAIAWTGLLAFFVFAIWLVAIDIPEATSDYVDASWHQALVDAHEHGRSFGNGIIFSAGPLGFLNSHYYLESSLGTKMAWEFGGKLVLALLLVLFSSPLSLTRRLTFLTATLLFSGLFPDTFFTVLLALSVISALLPPETSRWRLGAALVILALLAQIKFTHCVVASAGVALATGARLLRRDWRGATVILAGFVVAFLALWLAAGQNPVRLPDYFRYSWQISAGYAWAMSLDESWPIFLTGAAVCVLNAVAVWRVWRTAPEPRRATLPLILFLAAVWYVTWKHGFTRADGHVLAFFLAALLLGVAWPGFIAADARRAWFGAVVPLCLLGVWLADAPLLRATGRIVAFHWQRNLHFLTHPAALRAGFQSTLAQEMKKNDLPAVRKVVGAGTVDLINFEQGLLMLNGLNYHPRPIPQSYSVYTGPLMQKNAGFFRGPRAPEFLVVRMGSIDGRFPMQDDSLVLAELPVRYDLALEEGENAVYRRKAPAPPPRDLVKTLVGEQWVGLGADVPMIREDNHPLWLQVQAPLSWLGRIRSALYKPPQLFMAAVDNQGREKRYRIIPPIAETGFVIRPLIETTKEYAEYTRGTGSHSLRTIRFEAASPDETEFWTAINLRFSLLSDLPMTAEDPMKALVSAGIASLAPQSVTSDTTVQRLAVGNLQVLLVHATGEMVFSPGPDLRHVTGSFGFAEGAYLGGGQTDGADFVLEAEFADGQKKILWHRMLEPVQRAGDRGVQAFAADLPAGVKRLRLRTLPGGNGNWDWTWWSGVTFSP